jgi:hypothetical protein
MMKKQTAVEWLLSKLTLQLDANRYEDVEGCDVSEIADQAKQMEREQIEEAYKSDLHPCSDEDAEQYYNETYSK